MDNRIYKKKLNVPVATVILFSGVRNKTVKTLFNAQCFNSENPFPDSFC